MTGTTDKFAEIEAEVDRGEPWMFRDPAAPNPLTLEVSGLSTGFTKFGEATWLNGIDRAGKKWSILLGGIVLNKKLIDGLIEKWDEASRQYVVVETLGPVKPGEMVSIKYLGDKEGASFTYPNFRVYRAQGNGNGAIPIIDGGDATPAEEAAVHDAQQAGVPEGY